MQPGAVALGLVAGPASGARSLSGLRAQAGALLDTLEHLLTSPFPVAAPVPAAALLLLITRILSVDDSGTGASTPYTHIKGQQPHWNAHPFADGWVLIPRNGNAEAL